MKLCIVRALGVLAYEDAWALQNQLADQRGRDEIDDHLLIVEHPHTYTFGSARRDDHLLLSAQQLAERGITLVHADRGGDITYHGPGQVVGYPILKLDASARGEVRADVIVYVRALEEVIIRTLQDDAVQATRISGLTGVWVGAHKIAAIGVRVTARRVTKHGFAINLNPDLSYFDGIVPCGIADKGVTSLARLLGAAVDATAFTQRLVQQFGLVMQREIVAR
jgi:lipoyl(octanoyl) transferase